jgi:hypothetical protein
MASYVIPTNEIRTNSDIKFETDLTHASMPTWIINATRDANDALVIWSLLYVVTFAAILVSFSVLEFTL